MFNYYYILFLITFLGVFGFLLFRLLHFFVFTLCFFFSAGGNYLSSILAPLFRMLIFSASRRCYCWPLSGYFNIRSRRAKEVLSFRGHICTYPLVFSFVRSLWPLPTPSPSSSPSCTPAPYSLLLAAQWGKNRKIRDTKSHEGLHNIRKVIYFSKIKIKVKSPKFYTPALFGNRSFWITYDNYSNKEGFKCRFIN